MPELVNTGNVKTTVGGGWVALNVDSALVTALQGSIGSNANGNWLRLDNGLQVCWAADLAWTSDANGNWTWTFPQAFIGAAAVFGASHSAAYGVVEFRSGSSSSAARMKMVTPAGGNYASQSGTAALMAVGRWK